MLFGLYMSDLPIPAEIEIPVELLNRAAAGNAEAQFALAEILSQSAHEDDIERAEEWALKAAALGHVEAMYWLGEGYVFYAKEILEEDPAEAKTYFEHAFNWLSQASKLKHPAAILELSNFYRRGDVVAQDLAQSVALVQQAAALGEVQAMRDLACIYEHGLGVEINLDQANYWNNKVPATD